ncbi:MAG: hypothetical protein HY319_18355 [Armatimonadetes bacterium]|nr:hypothetical protein [Armatimonadota bacterium]
MWDIFKSRETRLAERGMANGLSYWEAHSRAAGAMSCDLNHAGQDAYMYSGNSVDAHRRMSGQAQGGFSGAAKEYYLRTGNYLGARRLQDGLNPGG